MAAVAVGFEGLSDRQEHIALLFGPETHDVPLVRVHSECLTGDVFGSRRCDCGAQLRESISMLAERGGVILYLRQEGRGIGLYNKLDAYRLQDAGMDTYAANRELRFAADARDYRIAVEMLRALNVTRVRLLTNNPAKCEQISRYGVEVVERLPTGVHLTDRNRRYLQAKAEVGGHLIDFSEVGE